MLASIVIVILIIIIFVILFRSISNNKSSNIHSLSRELEKIQTKYDYLRARRQELRRELQEKERTLLNKRNNQEKIPTISVEDLDHDETDESEKISRYLISQGKLTMEQHEKARQKMGILKMDYLGVCMALGYIDLETSKQVMKANQIKSKRFD